MLKLLKPAIQGAASDESGSFKEKKIARFDCGADTLGSFALLVSHDFEFQHIHKVVVVKIVRMGMLQILIANRLQDVTAKVETAFPGLLCLCLFASILLASLSIKLIGAEDISLKEISY